MCQRYVLPEQTAAEREFSPATAWWKFSPKFNVAPAQYVPAIRLHDRASEGVMLRWGLIPSWYEGEIKGTPKAWVRCHHIEQSKLYRAAWLDGRRCILPVAGFYAWQLTRDRYRQPFFVHLNNRSVFGIAAVWDRWVSEEDDVIESCSMIRVPTNRLMAEISAAADGMPAILLRKDYQTWLQGSPSEAGAVLQPYKPEWMQGYPVSPRVNSAAADDPSLISIAS